MVPRGHNCINWYIFSKKRPHASVGTHGYMAPEVLSKGNPSIMNLYVAMLIFSSAISKFKLNKVWTPDHTNDTLGLTNLSFMLPKRTVPFE